MPGDRRGAWGELAEQSAARIDALGRAGVGLGGRGAVEPCRADGDGDPLCGEGATVAGCIDADGEATRDREAVAGEMKREISSGSGAVGGRMAAADHGQLRLVQRGAVAEQKQHRGGPGDLAQLWRAVGFVGADDRDLLSIQDFAAGVVQHLIEVA